MSGISNTPALDALAMARIDKATDAFIAARLPDWLKRASPGQINRLRTRFKAHQQSQARVRAATLGLIPLQTFARLQLQSLLGDQLPSGRTLDHLQWLEIRRRFVVPPGIRLPVDQVVPVRAPALLRLMQNFPQGITFYAGSGLVMAGDDKPISGEVNAFVQACRRLDAGARYQRLLERVFTVQACASLAQDKREGFSLAVEVAALKGELNARQQLALQSIVGRDAATVGLRAEPGLLTMLGEPVADALVILLRDDQGQEAGAVLYLPSDPLRAMRHFNSRQQMNHELTALLRRSDYRDYFSRLVALNTRGDFLARLDKRLSDPLPDLALAGHGQGEALFDHLVSQQVRRVKDDARLLLVPTAEADRQASEQRRASWAAAGLDLANLAGLFIPVVGALLLGQLVAQTCAEVYEGLADWNHDHQHEALEHMLGVAETLAVTAAVSSGVKVVARGFAASDFVRGLEPVALDGSGQRLWANDLSTYATLPDPGGPQEDGLYGGDELRWVRVGRCYYEVQRAGPQAVWRLRHPGRIGAYGPAAITNGERGWRLETERPLRSDDTVRMLDSLWPQAVPLDAHDAALVLRISGMDVDELRGICVENRTVPLNLRHTLEVFQADRRARAFFEHVRGGAVVLAETDLLSWAQAQPGFEALTGEPLRKRLLASEPLLRARLVTHLCWVEPEQDPLLTLIRRDFPGLPERHGRTLLATCDSVERRLALSEQRLPLALNLKARALLRMARLNGALAGLWLDAVYTDETGELLFALLPRIAHWPADVRLELLSMAGMRRVAVIGRDEHGTEVITLMQREGRFRLLDANGRERDCDIAEPGGIFEAVAAALSPRQRSELGITGREPEGTLRGQAIEQLPASRKQIERLLGWPEGRRWFNPGRRLPDGRVGYLMSGRGPGHRMPLNVLRNRLCNLYPGLDDGEIDIQLGRLLDDPRSPYDVLLEREADLADLQEHLNRWIGAELNATRQAARRQLAAQLERGWRLQGETVQDAQGQPQGLRLTLIGLQVTTLPELPGHVEFPAVSALVLTETPITHVPGEFLQCFTALRDLNLGNNRLLEVPTGVGYLVALRRLRMAHNNLRLNSVALDILNGLPELRELDLSYNPLGAYHMRYDQLSHLVELNLRYCQLDSWPSGIERCELLERADLRDNRLATVPGEILRMPHFYRRAFLVERNRLGRIDLQRLFALDGIEEGGAQAGQAFDPASTQALWVPAAGDAAHARRSQVWDTLVAMPDSEGLFRLLGRLRETADFKRSRENLRGRVWTLLEALEGSPELREQIFARAHLPTHCENSVADRFSELQLRRMVYQAEHNTLRERGNELLAFGQGLFKLDQVERFARQDIRNRLNARERVDQMAVSLYYRVALRQRLGLPAQPEGMVHAYAAQVTAPKVEEAYQAVRAAITPQALADSLSQRVFWRRYLQERHALAFEALAGVYAERRGLLDAEQPRLAAMQYGLRLENLQSDHESDLQALVMQLTRQLLLGRERGQA